MKICQNHYVVVCNKCHNILKSKIVWIFGYKWSKIIKLIKKIQEFKHITNLDDNMWENINIDLGFSKKNIIKNNVKITKLAIMLKKQRFDIIISTIYPYSTICPYKKLRDAVRDITNCSFIYLGGGKKHKDYPYEIDKDKYYFKKCIR